MTSLSPAADVGSEATRIVADQLRTHYPDLAKAVDRSTATQVVLDLPARVGTLDDRMELLLTIARAYGATAHGRDACGPPHTYEVRWLAACDVQIVLTTPLDWGEAQ